MCPRTSERIRINLHLPNLSLLYSTNISRFCLNRFKTHSRPSKVRATECCWWIGGTPKCRLDCWDRCAIEEAIAALLFQSSLISLVALGRQQILWYVLKLKKFYIKLWTSSNFQRVHHCSCTNGRLISLVKSVKKILFLAHPNSKGIRDRLGTWKLSGHFSILGQPCHVLNLGPVLHFCTKRGLSSNPCTKDPRI